MSDFVRLSVCMYFYYIRYFANQEQVMGPARDCMNYLYSTMAEGKAVSIIPLTGKNYTERSFAFGKGELWLKGYGCKRRYCS